jgi:hypothetical protein
MSPLAEPGVGGAIPALVMANRAGVAWCVRRSSDDPDPERSAMASEPTPRARYDDFVRAAPFWPIGPGVMEDAVAAMHGLVHDTTADPGTIVQAARVISDIHRLNLETLRVRMAIESQFRPALEEAAAVGAVDRDLKALLLAGRG